LTLPSAGYVVPKPETDTVFLRWPLGTTTSKRETNVSRKGY
jgi:hypothetical protein